MNRKAEAKNLCVLFDEPYPKLGKNSGNRGIDK